MPSMLNPIHSDEIARKYRRGDNLSRVKGYRNLWTVRASRPHSNVLRWGQIMTVGFKWTVALWLCHIVSYHMLSTWETGNDRENRILLRNVTLSFTDLPSRWSDSLYKGQFSLNKLDSRPYCLKTGYHNFEVSQILLSVALNNLDTCNMKSTD